MVFTTTNLFKGIACPEGAKCRLTSCIFSHDLRPQGGKDEHDAAEAVNAPSEPATKRRKITADDRPGRPLSKSDQIREQLAAERKGTPPTVARSLPSLERAVTPPPTNGSRVTRPTKPQSSDDSRQYQSLKANGSTRQEGLNPRLVPQDPAGHAKRTLYLKHMHTEMVKLNERLPNATPPLANWQAMTLDAHELIKLALDEEEILAKESGQLYPNKTKQQIVKYRKMSLEAWVDHVKATVFRAPVDEPKKDLDEKVITTGLRSDEEHLVLPYLVADQTNLAQFGYIPTPPTEEDAANARAQVDFGKNWEKCDRCSSNFQVFAERNGEGLLTSNGPCKYHPLRKVQPPKTKNDFHGGVKQPYHPCCNEIEGSVGCTTQDSHVFKIDPVWRNRLAGVLPFINTPENPNPRKDKHGRKVTAVSFDCEMGYTTCGLELIRLTAVSWPSGDELVDVLVRPVGTIIDLNSRFSGVFPEHFANAIPYEDWATYVLPPPSADPKPTQVLPVVQSITAARALLTSYLTPQTPLIGHAIDNDLNVTRLCHPTIIDTIILFRHPRGPLPMRLSLRQLSLQYLGKRIQQGGDRGHDSAEDARATGELVRVKVKERWAQLQRAGCVIEKGQLGRRMSDGLWRSLEELEKEMDWASLGAGLARKLVDGSGKGGGRGARTGKKRKQGSAGLGLDGACDEGGETTEGESEGAAPVGNGIAAFLSKT